MSSKEKQQTKKPKGVFHGTIEELRQKILRESDMDGELLLTPGLSHSSSATLRNTLRDMEKIVSSKYQFFRIEAFRSEPARPGRNYRYTLTQPVNSKESSNFVWINESLISQWFPRYQDRQTLYEIASEIDKEQKELVDHLNRVERKKKAFREILQNLQTKNVYRPETKILGLIEDEENVLGQHQRLYVSLLTTFAIAPKEMESVLAKLSSDAPDDSKSKALRNFSQASSKWPSFSAADSDSEDGWDGEYNLTAISSSMAYHLDAAAAATQRLAAQREELLQILAEKARLLASLQEKSVEEIIEDYGRKISDDLLLASKKKKNKKG